MDYRLKDVADASVLQGLLDRLSRAVPVRLAVADADGCVLASAAGFEICSRFHMDGPGADACRHGGEAVLRGLDSGDDPVVTTCPHGLTHCAIPIFMAGRRAGCLMFGQFFTEPPDAELHRARARERGYDGDRYLEVLGRVPVLSRQELERYAAYLRVFAEMVGEMACKCASERDALKASFESNEKLNQANGYNRGLIEANADAMAVIDRNGYVTDVNAAAERLSGFSREQLIGRRAGSSIVNPALARAMIARVFRDGGLQNLQMELRHADGRKIPVLMNLTAVGLDGGRPKGLLATVHDMTHDISGRRHAEQALQDSEMRIRGLFDAMAEGVAVHELVVENGRAVDYVITNVNSAYETHTGISAKQAVGARASVLYAPGAVPFLDLYAKVASTGRPVVFDSHVESFGKHFQISVFSPRRGQFVCVFSDVTEKKRADAELRAAKEYAEELINTANAIVLVLDGEGRVREFNRAAEELTGWKKEELIGRSWFETLVPRDRYPDVWAKFERAGVRGFPAGNENPILTKSGKERYVSWHNSVFNVSGGAAGLVSFGLDVTERRRMETELRAYRERLDMVLKNLDAMVFQLDRDGRYTMAEGKGLVKIGVAGDRLLGRTTSEVSRDAPDLQNAVRLALSGKRASFEFTAGGAVFEEFLTPYRGADGAQEGVIGLAVDITERKKAEQKLREEKERLRVTLQSIGDGVIATDALGRVVLMNSVAEALTGWTQRKAAGRMFEEVFDICNEKTGERCVNPVERVLATGSIVGLANHTALRSAKGVVRSIADSAAPIMDENRNILGVILVFRDVTENRRKEGEIVYLSYHDRLTGLYNRAFLEEEARRLDTARQLPISVIMGDVNGLKLTNDVFGHAEGDNLLLRIAGILRRCCRNEDIIARVGGDEFCILLPRTNRLTASEICKRVAAHCEAADGGLPGGGAKLSISLGFATKDGPHEKMPAVMKAAEDMMYRRKLLESRSQHSFLISSIRTTLFEKSYETEQHAQRLIAYSKGIAQAMNLPDDQVNDIELFALLHDIGKIAIDSHILTKPGCLDAEEWEEMRRHPEIGFRIAQASPDLAHIAEYILCHHERWDGAGYPQGIKGTAIPLLARILIVVDAYDAMTQDRVYRKAMSREEACAELLLNAGTQFDPNIVWAFMEMLEQGGDIA